MANHSLVLVFDLGGVLSDFRGAELIARTSKRPLTLQEVRETWLPLVRDFEVGACSEAQFADRVVSAYELTLDSAAFIAAFREAAAGFYEGALTLIGQLRDRYRVISLSNTNGVQWPEVRGHLAEYDPFHAHFPSHVSGYHKPDSRAYEAVSSVHDAGSRFCFFDDRSDNVAAAKQHGWDARLVRGVGDARQACVELGLLESARG